MTSTHSSVKPKGRGAQSVTRNEQLFGRGDTVMVRAAAGDPEGFWLAKLVGIWPARNKCALQWYTSTRGTGQLKPGLRRWRLLRPSMHTNVASIDSLQAVVGMRNAVLRSTAHRLTAGGARVFGYWLTKAQVGICKPEAK